MSDKEIHWQTWRMRCYPDWLIEQMWKQYQPPQQSGDPFLSFN